MILQFNWGRLLKTLLVHDYSLNIWDICVHVWLVADSCAIRLQLKWLLIGFSHHFVFSTFWIEIQDELKQIEHTNGLVLLALIWYVSLSSVSWISGSPSRSMLRSQLTGGTARLTKPCSLVSSNTVRNAPCQRHMIREHTDLNGPTWQPITRTTCQHHQTCSSGVQPSKRHASSHRHHIRTGWGHGHTNASHPLLLPPVDWCCYDDSYMQLAPSVGHRECDWWQVSLCCGVCVCVHVRDVCFAERYRC